MKLQFNTKYLLVAVLLLFTEIYIGLYVTDKWIRPFFGDFLVVMLLYAIVRGMSNLSVKRALIAVLLFSYTIETLQHFHYVELLGLQNNRLASILMGTYFSWIDMLMYTLGILAVFIIEKLRGGIDKVF